MAKNTYLLVIILREVSILDLGKLSVFQEHR